MVYEVGPEAVPIAYTSSGRPGLYAVPLTAADLCAPSGSWSVLRAPEDDHPQATGIFDGVVFPTRDVGYVRARNGLLLKTEDGGRSWSVVRHDLPAHSATLAFPTPAVGYLGVRRARLQRPTGHPVLYEGGWESGAAQTLLRTGDGGQTWELLTPLVDAPTPRHNRAFFPHTTAYDAAAVAAQLQLALETQEVLPELPGTLGYLQELVFPSADVGYALVVVAGPPSSEARLLLRSSDGGHTWHIALTRESLAPLRSYAWSLAFPRPDIGYVLLLEKLLCTIDGGVTWAARPYPQSVAPSGIIFATATTGYLLGAMPTGESRGSSPKRHTVLLRTEDSGHSWQQIERDGAEWPFGCPGPEVIVAGGTIGTLRRSGDGGRMWHEIESGTRHELLALSCPDAQTCYGVGSDATIIKSTDGGQSWQVLTTGSDALYRMLNASHLLR